MTDSGIPFSKRHGFDPDEVPITIRNEAPDWLRDFVVSIAQETNVAVHDQREILCRMLIESPDPNNWSPTNVEWEVRGLLGGAEWYYVYDYIEAVFRRLLDFDDSQALELFSNKINDAFSRKGVGWKLVDGRVEIRGDEVFEKIVGESVALAGKTNRILAGDELHKALFDLSRRPKPDITGAIQHAGAALECLARDVTGLHNKTLGDIIKVRPDMVPSPLDEALKKIWGYVSNNGRHLREGSPPSFDEAGLIVGLAGSIGTYLMRKTEVREDLF